MKAFIDFTARPTNEHAVTHGTEAYLEWQTHSVDPAGISYTYVTPLDRTSFVVSVCWEGEFDKFVPFIFHAQLGADWVRAYSDVWPTFGEVLGNAMGSRYGAPSLVNFADPDDGHRKWHVASFVGHTTPKETFEELINDPRVEAAAQLVMGKSIELLGEMCSGREIGRSTKLKLMGKSMFASHGQPRYDESVWLSDISKLAWR